MKRFLFLLLSSLLLFSLVGCNFAQKQLTVIERNKFILKILDEKNPNAKNLMLLLTHSVQRQMV